MYLFVVFCVYLVFVKFCCKCFLLMVFILCYLYWFVVVWNNCVGRCIFDKCCDMCYFWKIFFLIWFCVGICIFCICELLLYLMYWWLGIVCVCLVFWMCIWLWGVLFGLYSCVFGIVVWWWFGICCGGGCSWVWLVWWGWWVYFVYWLWWNGVCVGCVCGGCIVVIVLRRFCMVFWISNVWFLCCCWVCGWSVGFGVLVVVVWVCWYCFGVVCLCFFWGWCMCGMFVWCGCVWVCFVL